MGIVNSDICRFCYTQEETVEYILSDCEDLAEYRRKYLRVTFHKRDKISRIIPSGLLKYIEGTDIMNPG